MILISCFHSRPFTSKCYLLVLTFTLIQKLTQSGVKIRGSYKFKDLGDVVYVRLANIVDAPVLYNAMSKDHNDLAIEYVSSNAASQVCNPETVSSVLFHCIIY